MTDEDAVDRLTREWIAAIPDGALGEYPLFARIMHAARLYEEALGRIAAAHGMSYRDVYLLMALRRAGAALTPTQLIGELSITMAAITKRIDRLVEAGYVERSRDGNDGRSVRIALTERGCRLVDDDIWLNRRPEFRAAGEVFSAEETAHLIALLRRLLVRLEGTAAETRD